MINKTIKGESISAIGQGTMGFGGYFTADPSRDTESMQAIQYAIDLGVTMIDLSELYGGGHCEEIVGKAIAGRRNKCFLVLKIAPRNLAYDDAIKSVENSLKRLNTDVADACLIHWPNPSIPIEETIKAADKLLTDGKIRQFGVSNFSLPELQEAEKAFGKDFLAIQSEYSLFNRYLEEDVLPYCQKKDMVCFAYSPLDNNRTFNYGVLDVLAKRYNYTPQQLALKWLVWQKNVIPIPKSISKHHILQNVMSAELKIDEDDLKYMSTFFEPKIREIPVDRIKADKKGLENFIPSVEIMAKSIQNGIPIKPIRVRKCEIGYELTEGKARYWAWVLAYDSKKPIKTLVSKE